jgi:hypothetical protein
VYRLIHASLVPIFEQLILRLCCCVDWVAVILG